MAKSNSPEQDKNIETEIPISRIHEIPSAWEEPLRSHNIRLGMQFLHMAQIANPSGLDSLS